MPEMGGLEPDMAEEIAQEAETEQLEEQQAETDWQAEAEKWKSLSREWEKKAKATKNAAKELEELKQAQMTEQEKAIARAEAAESELAELRAQAERHEAAVRISSEKGIPAELLEFCSDSESMEAFAAAYVKSQGTVHAVASADGSRIIKGNTDKKRSKSDQFAAALEAAGL